MSEVKVRDREEATGPATVPDQEWELMQAYYACFSGPAGEVVLTDLYNLCHLGTSVFVQAEHDPVRAAFYDGMRYVALRLFGYSGRKPYEVGLKTE